LRSVLEGLAAVSAFVNTPFERLLAMESRRAPWGATLVLVTAVVSETLVTEILRLRRAGRRVALVSLDSEFQGLIPGIKTTHIDAEWLSFSPAQVPPQPTC
jgi:hypothetical protein